MKNHLAQGLILQMSKMKPRNMKHACVLSCFSRVWLFATPWTVARQAPLSMGFSKQEYWSEFPCPPPGDLLDPGIKPTSLLLPALAGGFFTTSTSPRKPRNVKGFAQVPELVTALESESEVAQSSPTLCDSIDCSLPGSFVHGIFQAIVLEWIAMPFSRGSSWPRNQTHIFYVSSIGRPVLYY